LVRNPHSASRRLLNRFVTDFVERYRSRKAILFYELTNEMNLAADLDLRKRCCKGDPCIANNFTTAEMTRFAHDMVNLIKKLDPSHRVSSGYSLPRSSAMHLVRHPEFALGRIDWSQDTAEEFKNCLIAIHQPFDIVSIHVYPTHEVAHPVRGPSFDTIEEAAIAARSAGKPLFVGEFGDTESAPSPFMTHILSQLVRDRIEYAALWIWEYYTRPIYKADPRNREPAYSERLIQALMDTADHMGQVRTSSVVGQPRVILVWPLPCSIVDQPIELVAVASDGVGPVRSVQFLADGKLLAVASAPPDEAHFDPTGLGARTAEIEARGLGASGASATFRSTIRLNGANVACTVRE
jgi:hypothetical protein